MRISCYVHCTGIIEEKLVQSGPVGNNESEREGEGGYTSRGGRWAGLSPKRHVVWNYENGVRSGYYFVSSAGNGPRPGPFIAASEGIDLSQLPLECE